MRYFDKTLEALLHQAWPVDLIGLRVGVLENMVGVINHGGDHLKNYYDHVQGLLDAALAEVKAGNLGAGEAYKGVCKTIKEGLTDGSIKLYDVKNVFPAP